MRETNTGVIVTVTIGAIVLGFLLLVLLGGGFMGWGMMGPGHMWWDGNGVTTWWRAGMMIVMMIFWLAILVAFVGGIAWLIRQSASDGVGQERGRDRALDILRERYARGEISKEEFDSMRRDLE